MNQADEPLKVSVVIATLGNSELLETINILNANSLRPNEILICIPRAYYQNLPKELSDNVRIIQTESMGQVLQRIAGFKEATNDLVLQMDDDIHLSKQALETLVCAINSQMNSSCVSPVLINRNNGSLIYKHVRSNSSWTKIFYWIISGSSDPKQGSILSCGEGYGYESLRITPTLMAVEWLAGGCVLHNKNNLIVDNYFPFIGKAYCEDLIHSHLLRQKGINLYIAKNAYPTIVPNNPFSLSYRSFFNYLVKDFKVRAYLVKIMKLSRLRMYFFYLIQVIVYFSNRISPIVRYP
jgi:hypothetical protein